MKIKTKLTLGVGLLFFLIVLLVALGVRQLHTLANDTENILVDNYNSLDYSPVSYTHLTLPTKA